MIKDRYLFRGFHKEENGKEKIYIDGQVINGKWVYGWLFQIKYATKKYFIRVFPNKDDEYVDYVVIPETIGQYTGLEDKNGKKIFEKDWLYDEPNNWHYTVGFEDGVFCLLLDDEVVWDDVYEYKNQCEVISTIFDRDLIRE